MVAKHIHTDTAASYTKWEHKDIFTKYLKLNKCKRNAAVLEGRGEGGGHYLNNEYLYAMYLAVFVNFVKSNVYN